MVYPSVFELQEDLVSQIIKRFHCIRVCQLGSVYKSDAGEVMHTSLSIQGERNIKKLKNLK